MQGGPKVDLLLIAYLHLWLKFWEGIDKHWIVPVRKLFYFHHCQYLQIMSTTFFQGGAKNFVGILASRAPLVTGPHTPLIGASQKCFQSGPALAGQPHEHR